MTNLEEFFKNRITFDFNQQEINVPSTKLYLSNNIITPKKYTLKCIKENVKIFMLYVTSFLKFNYHGDFHILLRIYFVDPKNLIVVSQFFLI